VYTKKYKRRIFLKKYNNHQTIKLKLNCLSNEINGLNSRLQQTELPVNIKNIGQ
jgi:hypothetical protein